MILNSKETTIAYRCPICGKFIFGLIGIFTLSGDLIKLKCDCKGSELSITYTPDKKLRIKVPCLFCPTPHTYVLSSGAFFDRELLALSCTYSNMDVCFIGDKEKALKATKESDAELIEILDGAGFDDFQSFIDGRHSVHDNSQDNVNDEFRIDYAQIQEIVRFMLAELAEDGDITCGCVDRENAAYDFEFKGENVRVFCRTCGHEKLIPMSSTLAANAFLHTDKLALEKGE